MQWQHLNYFLWQKQSFSFIISKNYSVVEQAPKLEFSFAECQGTVPLLSLVFMACQCSSEVIASICSLTSFKVCNQYLGYQNLLLHIPIQENINVLLFNAFSILYLYSYIAILDSSKILIKNKIRQDMTYNVSGFVWENSF